jgi:DNA-binding NarL/FixJ family response regulator
MNELRILVADDHELIRRGIRELLAPKTEWKVVAEVSNGRDAVRMTEELKPDVVILDFSMPEMSGQHATLEIARLNLKTEVIVLTMHDSEEIIREVLMAGARGFVLKTDADRDLVDAVEAVAKHRQFFTTRVAEMVLSGYLSTRPSPQPTDEGGRLTGREREIVQLLAEGRTSREIAGLLRISVRTTETHRININRKLSFNSVADLVRYAIRNGITNSS